MKENRLGSALAGAVIGFVLGTFYYLVSAKLLITGPLETEGLFIPTELNNEIIQQSARWGGIAGMVIGVLTGLTTSIAMPRGYMSKSISATTFLVCTIMAFVRHGGQMSQMTTGRIAMMAFYIVVVFFLTLSLGQAISFIEKIRE